MYKTLVKNFSEKNLEDLKKLNLLYSNFLLNSERTFDPIMKELLLKLNNASIPEEFLNEIEKTSNFDNGKYGIKMNEKYFILDCENKSSYFCFAFKNLFIEIYSNLVWVKTYHEDIELKFEELIENRVKKLREDFPVYELTYTVHQDNIEILNFLFNKKDLIRYSGISEQDFINIIFSFHYDDGSSSKYLNDVLLLTHDLEFPFGDIADCFKKIKLTNNKLIEVKNKAPQ